MYFIYSFKCYDFTVYLIKYTSIDVFYITSNIVLYDPN